MPSPQSLRPSSAVPTPAAHPIARRLVKVASLGLAGLIAGLLTGCSATSSATDAFSFIRHRNDAAWQASIAPYSPAATPFRSNGLNVQPSPVLEQHYLNSPARRLHDHAPRPRTVEARIAVQGN